MFWLIGRRFPKWVVSQAWSTCFGVFKASLCQSCISADLCRDPPEDCGCANLRSDLVDTAVDGFDRFDGRTSWTPNMSAEASAMISLAIYQQTRWKFCLSEVSNLEITVQGETWWKQAKFLQLFPKIGEHSLNEACTNCNFLHHRPGEFTIDYLPSCKKSDLIYETWWMLARTCSLYSITKNTDTFGRFWQFSWKSTATVMQK